MDNNTAKKESNPERRELVNTLTTALNPLIKNLQTESSSLQLPQLALRCAQFFHSVSQYCLQYYRNDVRQKEQLKTKNIRKQAREGKEGRRGRRKKEEREGEEGAFAFEKPEPPRKPLTAYIIYFQDKKQHFVERYPTLNLSELTKLIAKEWKELSERERQVFLDRASEDRRRYEEQMAHFKRLYGKVDKYLSEQDAPEPIQIPDEVEDILKQAQIEQEPEEAEAEGVQEEAEAEAEMEAQEQVEEQQQPQEEEGEGERSSEQANESQNNESFESAGVPSNEKEE